MVRAFAWPAHRAPSAASISTNLFGSSSRLSTPGGKCWPAPRRTAQWRRRSRRRHGPAFIPAIRAATAWSHTCGATFAWMPASATIRHSARRPRQRSTRRLILRLVQTLSEELPHRFGMCAIMLHAARHDLKTDAGQRGYERRGDEDDELAEINERGGPEREIRSAALAPRARPPPPTRPAPCDSRSNGAR